MSPGFRNFFGLAAGHKSGFPQKKGSHPAEKAPQSAKTGAIFHFPQNFSTPCGKQRGKNSGFSRLTKRLFRVCGAPQHGAPGSKKPPHGKSSRHRGVAPAGFQNAAQYWAPGCDSGGSPKTDPHGRRVGGPGGFPKSRALRAPRTRPRLAFGGRFWRVSSGGALWGSHFWRGSIVWCFRLGEAAIPFRSCACGGPPAGTNQSPNTLANAIRAGRATSGRAAFGQNLSVLSSSSKKSHKI